MPGIGPAGNAPDYDALVKADPASLYPVSPDISYLCQIAMDYEEREQYGPLVDEIGHDTLIPSLEPAFIKAFRQWTDIRDDAASVQALYETAMQKAKPDCAARLTGIKKIHEAIIASISFGQRDLEAVMRVAAAVIDGHFKVEPLRQNETVLWIGNGFIFYALAHLKLQLDCLKSRLNKAAREAGAPPQPRGTVLFLPLSAARLAWFAKEYDPANMRLNESPSKERLDFMEEIKTGDIDGMLRGLAASHDHVRVIGGGAEAKLVEWRLQFLGVEAGKFSPAALDASQINAAEWELLEKEELTRRVVLRGDLYGQLERAVGGANGRPVYRDKDGTNLYLAELQSFFWDRMRLTLIKAILARERGRIGVAPEKYPKIDETLAAKITKRAAASQPLRILIAGDKDVFAFAVYLLVKEYIMNNGLEQMTRVRFVGRYRDELIGVNRSLIDAFQKISKTFNALGLGASLDFVDQGLDKVLLLAQDYVNEADLIITDNNEVETEARNLITSNNERQKQDWPVFVNIKTLMVYNGIKDYEIFLLDAHCIQIIQTILNNFVLPALRLIFNPRAYVLNYNKKHLGTNAQDDALEALKSWANNSRGNSFFDRNNQGKR